MNRNYALEFVRVTEAAAIAAASMMGRGDEKAADHAAVEAKAIVGIDRLAGDEFHRLRNRSGCVDRVRLVLRAACSAGLGA